MEETKKIKFPLFTKGDFSGLAYLVAGNIINYIIVIATLTGVLGWPDEIVFGRVIPGMSIGLLVGGFYYAWMAYRLGKKEGRTDVTALPSGVSTTAMFVILYGVVVPLHYAVGDPELAWSGACAACFIGGFIEFLGGFIGNWMRAHLPRAALLGTVAGIGFIWMATEGVFDIYMDPIVGVPILIVALLGLFGGYLFPGKIPAFVVTLVAGIVYSLALGRTSFDFTGVGIYFPNPVTTVQGLINGFTVVVPYLSIIIPVEIYNFIETMDNVESANAAGDAYSTREAQFADGICTMISAVFGGVVPNTVWLGHPGVKRNDARIGYSWVSGLFLGVAGLFGFFTFLNNLVPQAICAITFLWCAVIMVAQAFRETDRKHYAAIAVAMVPSVADFLFTQVTGSVGLADIWTETLPSGLTGYPEEIHQQILDAGVMWNGVSATKSGAIVIGIILGTMMVFIIDKKLDKAAIVLVIAAILSCFGFIHSAQLGFFPTSPFTIAYIIGAIMFYIFHLGRNSWFKPDNDFDYV